MSFGFYGVSVLHTTLYTTRSLYRSGLHTDTASSLRYHRGLGIDLPRRMFYQKKHLMALRNFDDFTAILYPTAFLHLSDEAKTSSSPGQRTYVQEEGNNAVYDCPPVPLRRLGTSRWKRPNEDTPNTFCRSRLFIARCVEEIHSNRSAPHTCLVLVSSPLSFSMHCVHNVHL